ncbi:DUF4136 domain-containing protein [Flavobacteriaceae bacterium Ap0902]|nr:DUF4136 domain-containing protein [Flavobacteriaceae bacterium Ap0902]
MKNPIYIICFMLLAFITSCSTAYVASDYDREVDFNQYKTYNFYSNIDWKDMNEFNQKAMLSSIQTELAKDGLTQSENPDILIDVLVDERLVKRQTGSVGVGSGSYGRGLGVGMSVGIPISTKKMQKNYVIEMVDAKNEHLVWQGVYEKDASVRADNQEIIQQAVTKMFTQYPPQK